MNPMKQSNIDNFTNISYVNTMTGQAIRSEVLANIPEISLDERAAKEYNDTRDRFDNWTTRFLTEFGKLTDEERLAVGHQKEEFIHSATFSGYRIPIDRFKTIQSHVYGNCFTLDHDDIVARRSGRKNSLYIVLNLETKEYLEYYTSSYGVRMVIHEKGTNPLPEQEGVTLNPMTEAHVGLRMHTITRLGGKYGECIDGREFLEKIKMNYTIPLCYSFCELEQTRLACRCILSSSLVMNETSKERICDFENDEQCIENVAQKIRKKEIKCGCVSPCMQTVYTSTLSSRAWPHKHYLKNVLLKDVCKRNPNSLRHVGGASRPACDMIISQLTKSELETISGNFIAVYIYFKDLNYEVISEEALYNTVRFLSDIGGALGLFVGASMLTCVEILEIVLNILLLVRCKRQQNED
ncbi:degenerin mec-10-like [Mercenaria mercenaria]|uniref:degenerin mec-10-like n=1 Tax=Mercenaria mercenaria TaxID=6596 RepID=UPI00234EC766|nr:degenerin mec-10-like [Mercenaria mercenaria]